MSVLPISHIAVHTVAQVLAVSVAGSALNGEVSILEADDAAWIFESPDDFEMVNPEHGDQAQLQYFRGPNTQGDVPQLMQLALMKGNAVIRQIDGYAKITLRANTLIPYGILIFAGDASLDTYFVDHIPTTLWTFSFSGVVGESKKAVPRAFPVDFRTYVGKEDGSPVFSSTRIWCMFPPNERWKAFKVPKPGTMVFITAVFSGYMKSPSGQSLATMVEEFTSLQLRSGSGSSSSVDSTPPKRLKPRRLEQAQGESSSPSPPKKSKVQVPMTPTKGGIDMDSEDVVMETPSNFSEKLGMDLDQGAKDATAAENEEGGKDESGANEGSQSRGGPNLRKGKGKGKGKSNEQDSTK